MKKSFLLSLLFVVYSIACAQTQQSEKSDQTRTDDLKKFMTKILGTKADVPKGSFVFDVSKSPELNLNVPLVDRLFNQVYLDGKVASSNNFTPLVKKGAWLPDVGINMNFNHFLSTTTKFYTETINSKYDGKIENASINDASQIFWVWWNTKIGYNFSTLETFNNDITLLNKEKFNKQDLNSLIFKTDFNFYFFPSKRFLNFLSFNGKGGFEYKTNDNNYSSLKSVNIKDYEIITDLNGKIIEKAYDVKSIKEGNLIVKNSANLNYSFMTLFSITDSFYIGLSTYGKRNLTNELKSLDSGFGITIPISKNNKDVASFTLKYEIPDINNEISNIAVKEKGILGFAIGVPINPFGKTLN